MQYSFIGVESEHGLLRIKPVLLNPDVREVFRHLPLEVDLSVVVDGKLVLIGHSEYATLDSLSSEPAVQYPSNCTGLPKCTNRSMLSDASLLLLESLAASSSSHKLRRSVSHSDEHEQPGACVLSVG